jgi:hypothetical protein
MPSTYTNNLGIQKPANGEQSGSWGDTVNTNSDILDVGINGVLSLTLSGTSSTLTTSDGTLSNGQYKALVLTGTLSGTHTITISPNDAQKIYYVYNTTGQTVIFTQGSGGNVTLLTTDSTIIYANGAGSTAAVVSIADHLAMSSARITGGSITGITDLAIADGGTGASDASNARFNLGLGTMSLQASTSVSISGGTITGITDLALADGGTGASTAANARTNLGLAIGTNVQAYDAGLQSISGLTTAADRTIYTTAADTYAVTTLTSFGRSIMDDADAAAGRTTLGLGTMATQAASAVAITGGTMSGTTVSGGTITSGTLVNTTSGTSFDFTSIPSWVKRITVNFGGVSTNGSSPVMIQIGDSGGIETTGYGSAAYTYNSGTAATSSIGYLVDEGYLGATQARNGSYVLSLLGSNAWSGFGVTSNPGVTSAAGGKTLSGTLDRIRITTVNGTDTFDSGILNIMYEG